MKGSWTNLSLLEGKLKEAVGKMRQIVETAEAQSRNLTAREQAEFDVLDKDVKRLKDQIEDEKVALAPPRPDTAPSEDAGIRALSSKESVEEHLRSSGRLGHPGRYEGVTFGSFIRGMVIPEHAGRNPVLRAALDESTDATGAATVPTFLVARLIDKLRAQATVIRAGAVTFPLDTDKTTMARLSGDPTASWHAENAAVTASDPTFEKVTFDAQTLISHVKASRELIEDAVNLDQALQQAFSQAMALELDRVALRGSGTAPEPKGIINFAGIGSVSMGVNGLQLTSFDKLLDALQALLDANAADPTAAILAPRTAITIAKLKDTTNQPLRRPEALANVPFLATTQVPVNDTQGTANNASRVILGNYRELLIGIRTQLQIQVLRERYSDNFQYGFLAYMRADVQLAHAASFCEVKGIIP